MTTILQSCLETQFCETATVMLKVAPSKTLESSRSSPCNRPTEVNSTATPNMSSNHDSRGWSFLQFLDNVSSAPKETMEKENVYVHPLTKQYSSSRLSEKSLELCTENLGSETGSDIMDISILSLSSSNSPTSSEDSWIKQEGKLPQEAETSSKCKVNNSRNFPPPLTTISGSNSLQFRPHREDGRLVIHAVEAPLKHNYFQAERSHGRLRLSFLIDHATKFASQLTRMEEDEVDVSDDEDEDCYQLEEEEDDEEGCNIFDVDVETGREKFHRLMTTRCNEGGHGNNGLCNWQEPVWVATS
ncbi:protein FANTASTIC FOUR 2-like [Coffea arabica]|uniref:Protein FANTASTIC FOUR 2-like n=1 Tax=Coffea arabica TaxID=13443 RepID=A0A6P6WQ16_COFAR|nr:protein FANTASTIC FOUR 3-like [Coffea arabica]